MFWRIENFLEPLEVNISPKNEVLLDFEWIMKARDFEVFFKQLPLSHVCFNKKFFDVARPWELVRSKAPA